MGFPQGIDFRATSGYVTDPTNCDFEIGTAVNYPRTTAQGNTVGWESISSSLLTRDRNTGTPKLAGVVGFANALTADVGVYRIDLSATGSWDIRFADGDHDNQCQNQTIEFFDNVTSLGVIVNNGDTLAPDKWFDATGVLRTSSADWVANNAALTATFASTILRIKFGPNGRGANTGGNTEVGHIFVQATAGGGTKAVTPAAITSTSAMSGAVRKLAAVKPAAITSTSAMSGNVQALKQVKPSAITSTSAVSGTVTKLGTKAIVPAAITSTSTVTGAVVKLASVRPSAINATSFLSGTVSGGTSNAGPFRSLMGIGI